MILLCLFDVILMPEQGISVDHYLKTLSVAPSLDTHFHVPLSVVLTEKWSDASLIFMAIRIADCPWEAPLLLHYAHVFHLMAKNTPGPLWMHYDREFHIRCQFISSLLGIQSICSYTYTHSYALHLFPAQELGGLPTQMQLQHLEAKSSWVSFLQGSSYAF